MSELLELVPLRYPLFLFVLTSIEYGIKHHTTMRNELIPPLLLLIAIGLNVGLRSMTSPYDGVLYYVDLLLLYGVVNSLKLTLYAVGSYEVIRAFRFSVGKKHGGFIMKRPFVRVMLGFFTATVLFSVISLICGSSAMYIFFKITDGWIFGVLFLACFDFWSKFTKYKDRISGVYITMLIMLLLSVSSFSMASSTSNVIVCIVALACSLLFGLGAGLCILIPFLKQRKSDSAEKVYTFEELQEIWVSKVRPKLKKINDSEKKIEILAGFLSYRLVNDSIDNGLDSSRAMCLVTDEDGATYAVSASCYGATYGSDATYNEAVSYIKGLV